MSISIEELKEQEDHLKNSLLSVQKQITAEEAKEEKLRKRKEIEIFSSQIKHEEDALLGKQCLLLEILHMANLQVAGYSDGSICIYGISKFDDFCENLLGKEVYERNRPR